MEVEEPEESEELELYKKVDAKTGWITFCKRNVKTGWIEYPKSETYSKNNEQELEEEVLLVFAL